MLFAQQQQQQPAVVCMHVAAGAWSQRCSACHTLLTCSAAFLVDVLLTSPWFLTAVAAAAVISKTAAAANSRGREVLNQRQRGNALRNTFALVSCCSLSDALMVTYSMQGSLPAGWAVCSAHASLNCVRVMCCSSFSQLSLSLELPSWLPHVGFACVHLSTAMSKHGLSSKGHMRMARACSSSIMCMHEQQYTPM